MRLPEEDVETGGRRKPPSFRYGAGKTCAGRNLLLLSIVGAESYSAERHDKVMHESADI